MSDGFGNMSMLELFREEMDAHAAALDTGLLALEASPDDRATLDALMRAAHSIKGAAKIVGLDAGVQIAHAMEDVFVSARAGELRIHRAMIDAELACVDLLRQLAACDEPAAKAFDHGIRLTELTESSRSLEDSLLDMTRSSAEFASA